MRKIMWKITTIYFIFCLSLFANEFTGKVIKVTDGDTINILNDKNETIKIRLLDIDAPEKKQAFGTKSKDNLAKYIAGKIVTVNYQKKDKYGRVLGTIYFENKDINLQQVKDGFAWVYRKYSNNKEYFKYETIARNSNFGLWADKKPIEPWNFRKMNK